MRRVVLAAFMLAAVGLGTFNAPAEARSDYQVGVVSYGYKMGSCPSPNGASSFTADPGDTVKWTNCDASTTHSVTADDQSVEYILAPGVSTDQITITKTFAYHCKFHSAMKATITVPETTTAVTTPPTTATTVTPTTAKPTTSTTPTTVGRTTTTGDINGALDTLPPSSTTTLFSSDTTRALGSGGDGTSSGVVALLVLGLGAIGTAAALVIRRMRAPDEPLN